MLTKSKSRSIANKITNLASRKSYLVIILPNSYQKLTKSKIRSLESVQTLLRIICLAHRKSIIIWANSCQKLTKSKIRWSWESVQTLLRMACLANRKSYVVIIYANACEKLTKSENVSSWSRFKYCSKVWKFYQKSIYSNIAHIHFHSSQFDH